MIYKLKDSTVAYIVKSLCHVKYSVLLEVGSVLTGWILHTRKSSYFWVSC